MANRWMKTDSKYDH
jgi:hypothetical protein